MTTRPTPFLPVFVAVLFILLIAPVAHGAAPDSAETIKPSVGSDAVDFQSPGFLELSLTVAEPDGSTTRLTAKYADGLSYGLFDDKGDYRADGLYSYELRGVDPEKGSLLLNSGFFSIAGGAFVDPTTPESTDRLNKEFLADNYYLQGSLCVGEDCQDGSAFDLTTLRLVENNLRILFDDSSSTPAFPNNDWMLRANETANGGANLFSIVDCGTSSIQCEVEGNDIFTLQAGAPANSLFVNSQGAIGIGTSNPSATLDVRGDVAVTGSVDGRDVGDDGATLDTHVADVANPHQVTAAQIGAEPSGTAVAEAAAAVAAHESAFDHGPLEAKAGKLWSGQFSGNPAMASVTFDTPFPSGTNYIVLLTGNTNTDNKAFKSAVRVQNDSGFTVTLGGSSAGLHFVAWLAYPLN